MRSNPSASWGYAPPAPPAFGLRPRYRAPARHPRGLRPLSTPPQAGARSNPLSPLHPSATPTLGNEILEEQIRDERNQTQNTGIYRVMSRPPCRQAGSPTKTRQIALEASAMRPPRRLSRAPLAHAMIEPNCWTRILSSAEGFFGPWDDLYGLKVGGAYRPSGKSF